MDPFEQLLKSVEHADIYVDDEETVECLLEFTKTDNGRKSLIPLKDTINYIFYIIATSKDEIVENALKVLLNVSSVSEGAEAVYKSCQTLDLHFDIVRAPYVSIINRDCKFADLWTELLQNITNIEAICLEVLTKYENEGKLVPLVTAYATYKYNKKCNLHKLANVFSNFTKTKEGRNLFLKSSLKLSDRILPYTYYEESAIRRSGAVHFLMNICADPEYHSIILNDDNLNSILYPFISSEEFTQEEMKSLPSKLQNLLKEKTPEHDPNLRTNLLDCLLKLCAKEGQKDYLKSKGTYIILLKFWVWEKRVGRERICLEKCAELIDIFRKEKENIQVDNIMEKCRGLEISSEKPAWKDE